MSASNKPPAVLLSIQVGLPKRYGSEDAADVHDKPWTTGFFKTVAAGPVFAGVSNLVGDGQADLINHGGFDKAVLAYSADHYPAWRAELNIPDMTYGAFGENLTIAGLTEDSVCLGDLIQIGEVKFEVSQPRQPCWKLSRRWRNHELTGMVVRNGRSGWYLRVITEGWMEAGTPVTLIERPNPEWTIARANEIMLHRQLDLPLTLELANVPGLADSWVEELLERAERLRSSNAV